MAPQAHSQDPGIYLNVNYQRSQPPADVQADPGNYLSAALSLRASGSQVYALGRGTVGFGLASRSPGWAEIAALGGADFRAAPWLTTGLRVSPFVLAYSSADGYRAWGATAWPSITATTRRIGAMLQGRTSYGRARVEKAGGPAPFADAAVATSDLRLAEASLDGWAYLAAGIAAGAGGDLSFRDGETHRGLRTWVRATPSDRIEIAGSILYRESPHHDEAGFLLTAFYDLDPNLRLEVAVTRTLTDLFLRAPQTFSAALGVHLRLAPRRASLSKPARPVLVELGELEGSADAVRRVRFSLSADADSVAVIGDFTGWQPRAMRRDSERGWTLDLSIAPGTYRFAFLADGIFYVPPGAEAVSDGFGHQNLILVVPGE